MYQHHLLPMSLVHASESNRCSFWMFSSDRLLCCTCFSSMQWDAIFTFSWKVIMTFCMAFLIVCHSGTDPLHIDIDIIIHCKSASSSRTLNIIYLFWNCTIVNLSRPLVLYIMYRPTCPRSLKQMLYVYIFSPPSFSYFSVLFFSAIPSANCASCESRR